MTTLSEIQKEIEKDIELEIGEIDGERVVLGKYVMDYSMEALCGQSLPDSVDDLEDSSSYRWHFRWAVIDEMEWLVGIRDITIRDVVELYNDLSGEEHERLRRELAELIGRHREGYMLKPRHRFKGKRDFFGKIDWNEYGWPWPTAEYEGVDVGDMPEEAYEEWLYECKVLEDYRRSEESDDRQPELSSEN